MIVFWSIFCGDPWSCRHQKLGLRHARITWSRVFRACPGFRFSGVSWPPDFLEHLFGEHLFGNFGSQVSLRFLTGNVQETFRSVHSVNSQHSFRKLSGLFPFRPFRKLSASVQVSHRKLSGFFSGNSQQTLRGILRIGASAIANSQMCERSPEFPNA